MKFIKKLSILFLSCMLVLESAFLFNTKNTYAATSYIKKLSLNTVYKYDIDGDGDKDSIKTYISKDSILLKVNNCVKKLTNYEDYDGYTYSVKIYNFNKKDKSLEIVLSETIDDYSETRILKFKNNTCIVNKLYSDAKISSYNPNTGMVTLEECFLGRYKKFEPVLKSFICYDQVKVNGYTLTNQYTANTTSVIRKNKYVASKNLTAYTSTSGTKKAFTVTKNSGVYVYALYQKGSTRYIKVKNTSGKYGYIKVGSSQIFKPNSCLYFR